MANQSSQIITDQDATPIVKTNTLEQGGVRRSAIATLAMTTGAAADIKRFVRIPSRALVLSVQIANDDLDSNATPTLATDVGLYKNAADGGAVGAGRVTRVASAAPRDSPAVPRPGPRAIR